MCDVVSCSPSGRFYKYNWQHWCKQNYFNCGSNLTIKLLKRVCCSKQIKISAQKEMTQKFKFSEGERVLCFHGPLIYEAKALKSTVSKDKQIKYYIHYAGWNKNWDEWVPEDRVLKYNEANVQRQQEVFKEHSTSASSKNKKAATKGKKGEGTKDGGTSSGGSESRASTPSKEVASLTGLSRSRSNKQTSTGGTPGPSKELSSIVKEAETKKDDAKDKETAQAAKDEKDDAQKKKRGGSTSSSTEKSNEKPSNGSSTTNSGATANKEGVASIADSFSNTLSERRMDETVGGSNSSSTLESFGSFLTKQEVKIKIPDELKQCLADDWDATTRQHKLIEIPAKITVQDIIDQYIAYKKSTKSTNSSKEVKISDVLNGIVEYFNVMLGSQLLYKYERPRYAEVLQQYPDTPPSKLYGSFHLLRLFIKLGSMLGYSGMDANKLSTLVAYLQDFLKFLVKNSSTYFTMANFVNATPEYHRNTQ